MNDSRFPPFAGPPLPLPRYPTLVDEGEAITLTMPVRQLRFAQSPIQPRPSRRARHLPILYGAAASVVLGVVLWLVATSSGTDRDARAQEHEVTPTARTRVAAEQNVEELPVIRAEDLPVVTPSNEERPAQPPEAPVARRSRR